jgi:hypothetical protein
MGYIHLLLIKERISNGGIEVTGLWHFLTITDVSRSVTRRREFAAVKGDAGVG